MSKICKIWIASMVNSCEVWSWLQRFGDRDLGRVTFSFSAIFSTSNKTTEQTFLGLLGCRPFSFEILYYLCYFTEYRKRLSNLVNGG